ncbi:hypothetical protein [Streptomyces sp. NPDC059957]|uniref:hypothetical protein n=1 Tax=Streptomyces sp. NPDC059957 TaxID=3347016 RepID=UPI003655AA90
MHLSDEERAGVLSAVRGEVFHALDGLGREGVPVGEESVEEEAEVGRVQVQRLPATTARSRVVAEQVVEQSGADLKVVTGCVPGGVVLEEGPVEEFEVVRLLGQYAGGPQEVCEKATPVFRCHFRGAPGPRV